jgi:preprotein translocase subunit SecE
MNRIKLYFEEAYEELVHKVTWPTWQELQQSALVVLTAAVVISAIVTVMDLASRYAIQEGFYKFIIK